MTNYFVHKTQNELLLNNLMSFYSDKENIKKMSNIINGETNISLRILDWFVTNYAKKNFTVYDINNSYGEIVRFKVYNDYKLRLKAYSKKRFDPFCRWERITIPCDDKTFIETTIGQLNFFKWSIENKIIDFIKDNFEIIENDMNSRNGNSRKKSLEQPADIADNGKTRKKREELSISACKCIKKETIKIVVKFN